MCMGGSPNVPDRPEKPRENPLIVGDEEQDKKAKASKRRGTRGLQIALNSGEGSSGLTV